MSVINRTRNITIFLLIVLIFFNLPLTVNAEERLTIPRWLIDSEIMENGDLTIVEDISFRFNDEYNGVFRDLVLSGTDGIDNVKVSELIEGTEVEYTLDNRAEKGDSNVYIIVENDENIVIQIYSPSEDEQKTFRISYTIKNVSVKYNDTGELNHKFLGEENNIPIDFLGINIKLPNTENDRVKIFAHGPRNGTINFSGNDTVSAEVENVPSNTFVELRVLFPVDFIPNSTNIVNKNGYDDIIDEELSFIQEIEDKEIRRENRKNILSYASIILSGLMAVFFVISFSKHRRNVGMHDINSLDPDDNSPAIVSKVVNGGISSDALMATIFDLARRDYITIEDKGEHKKKNNNFEMTRLNKSNDSILKHEKYFLEWIFDDIGDGKSVSTKDIEYYSEHSSSNFYNEYNEWTQIVHEESKELGYYDNTTNRTATLLIIASIITFIISIVTLVHGSLYGIALIIISIIAFIYSIVLLTRKSDYGYIQTKKWNDFKKDLKRRSETLNIDDLTYSLDKALIYGLALGIGFKRLKRFETYVPQSTTSNYWMYWFFLTNSRGENAFGKSINSSFESASSSISSSTGSGGGFSSGGGGGSGGGGAGGF